MRAATAILAVLGPAVLLGVGLFVFRAGTSRAPSIPREVGGAPALDAQADIRPHERTSTPSSGQEIAPQPPASAGIETTEAPAAASDAIPRRETALVFRVVDGRTSEALETFEARLGQSFLRPLLDEEGRVRLHFPEGRARFAGVIESRAGESVQLAIRSRGYRELRVADLFVPSGGELDLGTLRLERAPRLEVRVLDEQSGEPVAGARVALLAAGSAPEPAKILTAPDALDPWRARTGTDGRVLLESRPGETAMLAVRDAGHAPLDLELVLPLSEEHQETVRLRPLAPR